MEIIDNQGDKHWGGYDAVDHGFDSRMQSPFGAEQKSVMMPGVPSAPDWGQLLGAAWQQQGSIRVLHGPAAQSVIAALAWMTPPELPPGTAPSMFWTAKPSPIPNAWAQSYLASGYTLLIDVTSPVAPDGSRALRIIPPGGAAVGNVAMSASVDMPFAVVSGPPEVVNAAASLIVEPPGPPGPPGPPVGPGAPPPGPPPAQAGLGAGAKIAIVGGIVIGAFVVVRVLSAR